jgi:hypothetical protein
MDKPTTQLPRDFKEFIAYLNSERVEYLLVGGYAVSFHGLPRFTSDMDIWVRADATNAKKLGRALECFGFRDSKVTSGDFLKADSVFRMGVPPLQIDILSEVSGCDFTKCFARRIVLKHDEIEISMIALEDLKCNKRSAGRAKDLGDLEGLG